MIDSRILSASQLLKYIKLVTLNIIEKEKMYEFK